MSHQQESTKMIDEDGSLNNSLSRVEYDEPLSLHRTYANLDPDGYWVYWLQLENKKWIFNPRWVATGIQY